MHFCSHINKKNLWRHMSAVATWKESQNTSVRTEEWEDWTQDKGPDRIFLFVWNSRYQKFIAALRSLCISNFSTFHVHFSMSQKNSLSSYFLPLAIPLMNNLMGYLVFSILQSLFEEVFCWYLKQICTYNNRETDAFFGDKNIGETSTVKIWKYY